VILASHVTGSSGGSRLEYDAEVTIQTYEFMHACGGIMIYNGDEIFAYSVGDQGVGQGCRLQNRVYRFKH
jgi:hypothetical protein